LEAVRCNFCIAKDVEKLAKSVHESFAIVADPYCGADEQNSTEVLSPTGVAVLVGGRRAAWLMKLPEQCVCGD
jgi:hypothetical protein